MPEIVTPLSQRESEALKQYADQEGITEEEAMVKLAMDYLRQRIKTRFNKGEVRAFKSPKSD